MMIYEGGCTEKLDGDHASRGHVGRLANGQKEGQVDVFFIIVEKVKHELLNDVSSHRSGLEFGVEGTDQLDVSLHNRAK